MVRRVAPVTNLRLSASIQMHKAFIAFASRRSQSPPVLLLLLLAVQSVAASLNRPRPNPSVKGTSRKRAAPYVER
jgi:hypothetical protein